MLVEGSLVVVEDGAEFSPSEYWASSDHQSQQTES